MKSGPKIAIVVPTFRRDVLVKRWIRRIKKQTYPVASVVVVHDGDDAATRALMEKVAAEDPRFHYIETPERGNDFGTTPRIHGVEWVVAQGTADYVLFWDDDFYTFPTALETIVEQLRATGEPDLMLVPIAQYRWTSPRLDLAPEEMSYCHMDMASIVVRPGLAARCYPIARERLRPAGTFFGQDYEFFDTVRGSDPKPRMANPGGRQVGIYNGLFYHEFLISKLRRFVRRPLNLMSHDWYRRLTKLQPIRSKPPGA